MLLRLLAERHLFKRLLEEIFSIGRVMQLAWPKPNRTPGFVDVLGLIGLVGLLVARFVPVARLVPFWGCILRERTGWPCLGCGLTRVADRVAHFNLLGALQANPLGTVAALAFALCAVAMLLHLAFAMPIPRLRLSPREAFWGRVLLVALVLANYAFVVVATRFPSLLT